MCNILDMLQFHKAKAQSEEQQNQTMHRPGDRQR